MHRATAYVLAIILAYDVSTGPRSRTGDQDDQPCRFRWCVRPWLDPLFDRLSMNHLHCLMHETGLAGLASWRLPRARASGSITTR